MTESNVFWFGKRTGAGDIRKNLADDPEFASAMRDVCANFGCEVRRFVSAQGIYGTWIVEFERDGVNQRIVWNGKDERLVLQVERAAGGWDEPADTAVESADVTGFVAGIEGLMRHDDDPKQ